MLAEAERVERSRPSRTTNALHISMCFNGVVGTHGVSRTLATSLRRARADVRRRGYELAPVSGVEPLRAAFVTRSPKSLGPRARVGCSPGCRTQPSPLIWQLSRAYKARPHAGADYNKMDVAGGLAPPPAGL